MWKAERKIKTSDKTEVCDEETTLNKPFAFSSLNGVFKPVSLMRIKAFFPIYEGRLELPIALVMSISFHLTKRKFLFLTMLDHNLLDIVHKHQLKQPWFLLTPRRKHEFAKTTNYWADSQQVASKSKANSKRPRLLFVMFFFLVGRIINCEIWLPVAWCNELSVGRRIHPTTASIQL